MVHAMCSKLSVFTFNSISMEQLSVLREGHGSLLVLARERLLGTTTWQPGGSCAVVIATSTILWNLGGRTKIFLRNNPHHSTVLQNSKPTHHKATHTHQVLKPNLLRLLLKEKGNTDDYVI